jgi:hypothetical protein
MKTRKVNGSALQKYQYLGRLRVEVGVKKSVAGSLFHKSQTSAGSNSWSAYASLGGVIRGNGDPVVMANSDGRLQVFVVGTGGSLFSKVQTSVGSSTWSAWSSLGGGRAPGSNSAVAMNSDGTLQAFVVGTGGSLFSKVQIVTWGCPIASFRWDNSNSIDIKNLSVKEIVPPT